LAGSRRWRTWWLFLYSKENRAWSAKLNNSEISWFSCWQRYSFLHLLRNLCRCLLQNRSLTILYSKQRYGHRSTSLTPITSAMLCYADHAALVYSSSLIWEIPTEQWPATVIRLLNAHPASSWQPAPVIHSKVDVYLTKVWFSQCWYNFRFKNKLIFWVFIVIISNTCYRVLVTLQWRSKNSQELKILHQKVVYQDNRTPQL